MLMILQDAISDLPRACNLIASGTELDHRLHHNFFEVDMLLLLLDHQIYIVLVLLGAIYHLVKAVRFYGVSLGYILNCSTIDYNLSKHFDLLRKAVLRQPLHRTYSRRSSLVRCFPGGELQLLQLLTGLMIILYFASNTIYLLLVDTFGLFILQLVSFLEDLGSHGLDLHRK
jgi:hypothetical protein